MTEMFRIRCNRCGEESMAPSGTNICGNCADELRAEQDAEIAMAESQGIEEEREKYWEEQWEAQQEERMMHDGTEL